MAIKGKNRPRRGRTSSNAPRPVIVVPRKRFLARKGVQIGILALLLAGIAGGLFTGYLVQRNKDRKAAQGQAVEDYHRQVLGAVTAISRPSSPSGVLILPDLIASIPKLQSGKASPQKVRTNATPVPKGIDDSIETLVKMDIPTRLRNTRVATQLADAQLLMQQALRAYRVLTLLVIDATRLPQPSRKPILERAGDEARLAARLWDTGYQKITNLRIDFGTFQPQTAPTQAPIP